MRVVSWCRRHPVIVASAIAALGAVASSWAIWHQRAVGNLDPDEAGYLAFALALQRSIDPGHAGAVMSQAWSSVTGPLVPVLSVFPLSLGPRDVRAAMLVQPLLGILLAASTAAMARRVASSGWAILAGAYVAALPRVVQATETYWFGLGAAAFLALAIALLISPGCLTSRRRYGFGLALAASLLSRTMMVGLLPGVLVAVGVVAWGDRRRIVGAVQGLAVTAAIAVPWFVAHHAQVFGYLVSYGYGGEAARFGSGNLVDRISQRTQELTEYTLRWGYRSLPWQVAAAGLIALVVWGAVALAPRRSLAAWSEPQRAAAALGSVVVLGVAALASTTNHGIWFDLPLYAPLVALVVGLLARLPGPVRVVPAAVLVAVAVIGPIAVRMQDTDRIDVGFPQYDSRFTDPHSRDASDAADAWEALNARVADRVAGVVARDPRAHVLVAGNTFPANANRLELAAELDGWGMTTEVPDSRLARGELRRILAQPWERALVVVRFDGAHFVPDRDWQRVEAIAEAEGWRRVASWPLPVDQGGDAVLYLPPVTR